MYKVSDQHQTTQFLRAISDRLSGRSSCRQVEYTVCIGMLDISEHLEHQVNLSELGDISNKVFFYPERFVFPDRYHRQKTDMRGVVNHIMKTQFADTVFDYEDEYNDACFKKGSLVPGVYKYVLSFDKKRRQWIRIL